jgi:uncharacterized protein YggE
MAARRRISGMKTLVASLVLFGAAALAGVAQPHFAHSADTPAPAKTITVTGAGSVETVPDRAGVSFTVTSQADTAKGAMTANAAAAQKVVDALKPNAKLQTSGIGLDPRYDDSGQKLLGYTASTTLTADAELAKVGGLIDAAVDAGANGISGPSFTRSDTDALYRDALKDALADAKAKAQALAAAAGLTLGEIRAMSEGSQASPPQPLYSAAKDAAVPIEPGTQTVDAAVTVTYEAAG